MKQQVMFLLALTSCAIDLDEVAESDVAQDIDANNGTSLNGTSLNGTSLNGTSLNGTSLNGTSLNGTSLNGTSMAAATSGGPPLSGAGPVGSSWSSTTTSGQTVTIRIDSATQGTGANSDLWFYGVSYQNQSGWQSLCGVDSMGAPILAVPVLGAWKATTADATHYVTGTQYTWACRGKTVAKCVELGYKTWKGYSTQLQACVRLLRADFCGTGQTHTTDGRLLNLFDNLGVQHDTESWPAEAEWTAAGARCVNSNNIARYTLALQTEPKCALPMKTTTCGTQGFAAGAIMIDELAPGQ